MFDQQRAGDPLLVMKHGLTTGRSGPLPQWFSGIHFECVITLSLVILRRVKNMLLYVHDDLLYLG